MNTIATARHCQSGFVLNVTALTSPERIDARVEMCSMMGRKCIW